MIFLVIFPYFFASRDKINNVINITGESANPYLATDFLSQNRMKEYTYSTTGDYSNHSFSYAATGTYTTGSSQTSWGDEFNTTESQKKVDTFYF